MTTGLKPFIGITGGIGSGKSTICRIFSCLGIPVFEADKAAREICDQDSAVKEAIIAEFGPKAYLPDGSYNRAWIKGLLQKYPGDVAHLNAIIHPAVRQKATEWFAATPDAPFCLYESALITPQKKPEPISQIITVDAPLSERIQNIQKRSNMSYMETMQIIDLQPKPKNYLWGADFVIQNGKNDQVFPQVMQILKAFTCFLLLLVGPTASAQLKAMTFNVRLDTESDGLNQWKYRSKHLSLIHI
jgi:dephospho-CoA kinase